MIAYGMLYAAAVGLPIFLAAIACSAALRRYGRPERAVWLLGLGLALTFPVAFLTNPFGTSPGASGTLAETGLPAVASGTLPETGVLGLPAVVAVPVESGLGLDEILLLAWLLASVVLMLRWSIAAYRLKRVGAFWRAGTVDGVHVWLTSDLGPAVSGIIRTRILVPSWLVSLPQGQRSLVLLHEEEHVRARDPVLMAVSRIARIMAPWNPVVWLLSSRLLHAVELDCDRRVLGRRPDVETYGDTLLTVLARDSGPLVAAAAFTESEVPLRKRIIAMIHAPTHRVRSGCPDRVGPRCRPFDRFVRGACANSTRAGRTGRNSQYRVGAGRFGLRERRAPPDGGGVRSRGSALRRV